MSLIASVLPITVCLLYTVSLTSYPPQASAVRLPQEYDQDQMDTLISNFVQSPQSRDADQWFQLQQLKRKWNQDRLQNKRKSKQRRRNNACNPFTGKCSAGWKRSPPIQQDAADLEDRSLDFSQAPGASAQQDGKDLP
uniref:Neuropeptide 41 n=1 Tax=Holothuria leucospilota TaxID=206669 RepID=A0A5B8XAY7_HOLLE|nr:neuropeptide 41 [Holothuria leucospilota]